MLIIDPDRDGCTVWCGNKVQHIKGNPQECIERIVGFASKFGVDVYKREWTEFGFRLNFLQLDVSGEGRLWEMTLDKMRIWYDEIRGSGFL